MFKILREKPPIAIRAMEAKFSPNVVLQIVIFIAVFIVSQIASTIIALILLLTTQFEAIFTGDFDTIMAAFESPSVTLIMLFVTIIATIVVIIYCRFIEKRSLYSMGFVKKRALRNYMEGLLIGFVMFGSCVLIGLVTGTLVFDGLVVGSSMLMIVVFFIGFIFQGMSEEVMLRGYLMLTLTTKKSILFAIIANASIFAFIHLLNNGITLLSLLNLFLFGVFASIFTLKTNNILGICAIHTIWNFAQGNIFGILVSGVNVQESIFSFTSTESGTLINGGSFGLEGGLAVTFVLIVSTLITLVYKKSKDSELASV